MELRLTLAPLAHVPVYYWPWVWWQVFWLRAWAEAEERDILFHITSQGRVEILALGDDKHDLNSWLARQKATPRAHEPYLNNAAGNAHLNYFVLATTQMMERTGCFIRWIWVRIVLRPIPPFKDSS